MKTVTSVALCLSLSSVLALTQTPLTDDDAGKLVSRVKQMPASQLDSALPPMAFEKWLLLQVGKDAAIGWAVRTADGPGNGPRLIEADISIQGGPGIVITIVDGTSDGRTKPTFHSLQLMRAGGESSEWPRLRDLTAAMKRARDRAR